VTITNSNRFNTGPTKTTAVSCAVGLSHESRCCAVLNSRRPMFDSSTTNFTLNSAKKPHPPPISLMLTSLPGTGGCHASIASNSANASSSWSTKPTQAAASYRTLMENPSSIHVPIVCLFYTPPLVTIRKPASTQPSPVDSMREAMLTVSPKRQYLGIACPTTPVPHTSPLFTLLLPVYTTSV